MHRLTLAPLALGLVLGLVSDPASASPTSPREASLALHEEDAKPEEAPHAEASRATDEDSASSTGTLFGRPLRRNGFHFHASLGIGSGEAIAGLHHSMELGATFHDYSISLLHSLVQYRGVFGPSGSGPDEIGGFFLQVAGPLVYRDLKWKLAAGVGGTVDQPAGEFNAHPGFGVHYGIDLHFPIWSFFGPTASIAGMNVVERGDHYFALCTALGITFF